MVASLTRGNAIDARPPSLAVRVRLADIAPAASAAKECIQICRSLCSDGRYADAARTYVKAFETLRMPAFACAAGVAFYQAGDLTAALSWLREGTLQTMKRAAGGDREATARRWADRRGHRSVRRLHR